MIRLTYFITIKKAIPIYLFLFSILILTQELKSQEDTTEYETEEIIVTGTRIEQKIIDIPFSVKRIDNSVWKSSRQIGINDILTTVPGLFLQSRYGNHDVRITIRGFGSRSNSGIRGVRILLDGIPESEPDGQTRIEALDFSALGRIELVKGNSSSLYTNAPGGVINFLSDKFFVNSFILSSNEFGSYGLLKNGIKFGLKKDDYLFMTSYSYENYKGYRTHSEQFQNRVNTFYEGKINQHNLISVYGYYNNGLLQLPGSLTLQQYNENDTTANQRDYDRNARRVSKKGRLGITYFTDFKKDSKHKLELTLYGTIKELTRVSSSYRIISRSGVGSQFKYIYKTEIGKRTDEFSLGCDLFYQTGPVQDFNRVGWGAKGDELQHLYDESISNIGIYALNNFSVIPNKLDLLITGRLDRVIFESDNNLQSEYDTTRIFQAFTPKFALNFKLTPQMAIYSSFGFSFDSPAFNELDNFIYSSNPNVTINPDLQPQKSTNFEIGFKGNLPDIKKKYFKNTFCEITFFYSRIKDEIIPFTVDSDPYFRNAGTSRRIGVEAGITTNITDFIQMKSAYTFSDFKYLDYSALSITVNGDSLTADYSGSIMPSIPKNFQENELTFQKVFAKYYQMFFKINHQYVGSMYVDDTNTDSLKTKSYNLFNVQFGFNIYFKKLNILGFFGVNNIADLKYVSFIQINSNRDEFYEAGPRRNFFGGLSIGYLFNK